MTTNSTLIHPTGIHPTAMIDPTAVIEADVEIGPYACVGPHCRVGKGSKLATHAVLEGYVTLGENCRVSPGAVLGGFPQDAKFGGEPSWVRIGNNVTIREGVTVNRSTGENAETLVGDGCMLMAYSHVAHNCTVGKEVILANSAHLGGHVEVGDYAFLSALTAVHQFVKVGRLAILGGGSLTRQDIPPFALADRYPSKIVGINTVGLRRRGLDLAARTRLKKAFSKLFFSNLNLREAIETIHAQPENVDANVEELITFVQASKRGICSGIEGKADLDATESTAHSQEERLSEALH